MKIWVLVALLVCFRAPASIAEKNLNCDYWKTIDLDKWDAEMDRMHETFRAIEVTKDEVESASLMEYEKAKARWPGNEEMARLHAKPSWLLRIRIQEQKYNARHAAKITDEDAEAFLRAFGGSGRKTIAAIKDELSDLRFKVRMAIRLGCHCECSQPKMREICTKGLEYWHYLSRTSVPYRWTREPCFDRTLLPDDLLAKPEPEDLRLERLMEERASPK